MFRIFTLALLIACSFVACKNSPEQKPATTVAPPPPAPTAKYQSNLPVIPPAEIEALYTNCDFIDYTFYDPKLPMSISLDEISSIRSTFNHIAQQSPFEGAPNCKPFGRIFYQSKGEYIMEAEFYFTEGCAHLVFLKDGKPAYANAMTEAGKTFFANNINHGLKAVQQGAPPN